MVQCEWTIEVGDRTLHFTTRHDDQHPSTDPRSSTYAAVAEIESAIRDAAGTLGSVPVDVTCTFDGVYGAYGREQNSIWIERHEDGWQVNIDDSDWDDDSRVPYAEALNCLVANCWCMAEDADAVAEGKAYVARLADQVRALARDGDAHATELRIFAALIERYPPQDLYRAFHYLDPMLAPYARAPGEGASTPRAPT